MGYGSLDPKKCNVFKEGMKANTYAGRESMKANTYAGREMMSAAKEITKKIGRSA